MPAAIVTSLWPRHLFLSIPQGQRAVCVWVLLLPPVAGAAPALTEVLGQ
jgi:hypothetical protein